MVGERTDLISLTNREALWGSLPSQRRIQLKSVREAYRSLSECKLFQQFMRGRGFTPEMFLGGVTSLDLFTERLEFLFNGSLNDRGRQKLGEHVLGSIGNGTFQLGDFDNGGDEFSVKEALQGWVKTDLGVEIPPTKV